jgi:hypothetical protein
MTATVTCCEDKGTHHGTRIHKEDKVFSYCLTDPMVANIGKPELEFLKSQWGPGTEEE